METKNPTENAPTSFTASTGSRLTRDALLQEQPKIDAALKSFCSWLVASAATATQLAPAPSLQPDQQQVEPPQPWELKDALACARILSKAINQHVVPIQPFKKSSQSTAEDEEDRLLVARVWNEHAAMVTSNADHGNTKSTGLRLTKLMGRTALRLGVFSEIKTEVISSFGITSAAAGVAAPSSGQTTHPLRLVEFFELFEKLLQESGSDEARWVWSPDKGQTELARRAADRQQQAQQRRAEQRTLQQEQQRMILQNAVAARLSTTPTIEELPEEAGEDRKLPP